MTSMPAPHGETGHRAPAEMLERAESLAQMGTWHWDLRSQRVTWSAELYRLFDVSPREFVPTFETYLDRVYPADRAVVRAIVEQALHDHQRFTKTYRIVRRDGSLRFLEGTGDVMVDAAGTPIALIGVAQEVTRRQLLEAWQAGQTQVLQLLLDGRPLPEVLTAILKALEAQFGEVRCSVLVHDDATKRLRTGAAPSLPDDYTRAVDGLAIGPRAGACGTAAYRGEPVIVEDIATDPLWEGFRALALQHGLRACWSRPVRSGSGRLLGTLCMYYPSPRRPTEEERQLMEIGGQLAALAIGHHQAKEEASHLEAQLRQAQKMEAIGRLAGGMAHDFNNLLMVVNGYSEFLLSDLPPDAPHRPAIEEIARAGERGATLTHHLLAFSRKHVVQATVLDLNTVLARAESLLRRLIGEPISMTVLPANEPALILGDPMLLEQVVVNLAVNARDAMPEGGQLTMTVNVVTLVQPHHCLHTVVPPGSYVQLTVSDTGCGMDTGTLEHVFEPFFTTKEPGKGTGLGLATTYGIITQSGGFICVQSTPGRGTSFTMYLPKAQQPAGPVSHADAPGSALPQGTESILLVEDEAEVRDFVRVMLQRCGYQVLTARTPADALHLAQQHQGHVDLLLTDVVMPGMNGWELAQRLTRRFPVVRVVYMSGYTGMDPAIPKAIAQGNAFLQKPVSARTLAQKVREVLDCQS